MSWGEVPWPQFGGQQQDHHPFLCALQFTSGYDEEDSGGEEEGRRRGHQSATLVSVEVAALSVPGSVKRPSTLKDTLLRYPPLPKDRDRRCKEALQHIAQVGNVPPSALEGHDL